MIRLGAGDRAELRPLFEALWPLLRRFTGRMLRADADAEDAAQEAVVKLFRRAAEFDPEADAVAWALGIAAYECLTSRRRVQRRGEAPGAAADLAHIGDRADGAPSPEQILIDRDLEAAAAEILTVLRPEDREVIRSSLATARGERPPLAAAVRKRLSRALGKLREAWRARHGTDR
jgi:RNA polymerase sigma-70 factor, ECF subfamily